MILARYPISLAHIQQSVGDTQMLKIAKSSSLNAVISPETGLPNKKESTCKLIWPSLPSAPG
jgi:hypothetical protein